ncbi:unnamed protein product [Urochloa humidicola]
MDASISCLPALPLLMMGSSGGSSLADARALHYPMSVSMADSSLLCAPHQHNHSATMADSSSVLVADSRKQLAPAGGRAGKQRRSRASKRAPTTYISTDPANFRIMVQHITGLVLHQAQAQAQPDHDTIHHIPRNMNMMLPLPPMMMAAAADQEGLDDQLQHQPCFPTLDSWNVMYECEGRTEPMHDLL